MIKYQHYYEIFSFFRGLSSLLLVSAFDYHQIKRELIPLLRKRNSFDLESAKSVTIRFIRELMILTVKEREFLDRFVEGEYLPELLFDDQSILDRIQFHPMALWKTRNAKE